MWLMFDRGAMDDRRPNGTEIQRKIIMGQGFCYPAAAVPTVALTRRVWFRRIARFESEIWSVMDNNP